MRIDSHQHFWHYSPSEHTWMTGQMPVLKQDFLPKHLLPLLESIHFDGCVAVQARQSLEETRWLLQLAQEHTSIRGVVGWVDLCSEQVRAQLQRFAADPRLVGVRHVVHDEPDDLFMLRPEFRRGLAQLQDFGLTYDLLLFPRHLPVAVQLVQQFPRQPFVLDHIAKPLIGQGVTTPWADDLRRLAQFPNVFCKLSGMITEADWKHWQPPDFDPYLDIVVNAFGENRLMIGSDWPVCMLAGDYRAAMNVVIDYVKKFSAPTQAAILGGACAGFYGIEAKG